MHLNWHKSSYSGQHGGDCVEVAETPETVYVRDSQNRDAGVLPFPAPQFSAFLHALKHDQL